MSERTVSTAQRGRMLASTIGKPVLFAVLMWLASAAGEISIPGTPVPITLQTFVMMLAGLMLSWRQAGSAVVLYLAAGASRTAGVRRRRLHRRPVRPERGLPDRLPAGRYSSPPCCAARRVLTRLRTPR